MKDQSLESELTRVKVEPFTPGRKAVRFSLFAVMLLAVVISACGEPVTTSAPPPATALSDMLPTARPATLFPPRTPAPGDPLRITLTGASATALPASAGGSYGLPAAAITDLFVSRDGTLWVTVGNQVYRLNGDHFEWDAAVQAAGILGEGRGSRWLLLHDGSALVADDGTAPIYYDLSQGWEILDPRAFPFVRAGDGFAAAPDGSIWIATGGPDLRRLDPTSDRWSSLTAGEIGFDPPESSDYQGHYLTDVLVSQAGSVWVSDCMGVGEGFAGQGVRLFQAGQWSAVSETAGQCIFDLEIDSTGVVWAGGFDQLLRYEPGTERWAHFPLPAWERRQIINSIDLDPQGRPWLEIIRCGGASCSGAAYFYLDGEDWVQYLDPGEWATPALSSLAFTSAGEAWLCYDGVLYRSEGGRTTQVAEPGGGPFCQVAVDGGGGVWLLAAGQLQRVEGP